MQHLGSSVPTHLNLTPPTCSYDCAVSHLWAPPVAVVATPSLYCVCLLLIGRRGSWKILWDTMYSCCKVRCPCCSSFDHFNYAIVCCLGDFDRCFNWWLLFSCCCCIFSRCWSYGAGWRSHSLVDEFCLFLHHFAPHSTKLECSTILSCGAVQCNSVFSVHEMRSSLLITLCFCTWHKMVFSHCSKVPYTVAVLCSALQYGYSEFR